MKKQIFQFLTVLCLFSLLLAACRPPATSTPLPTNTNPPATATPPATSTLIPTATSVPPTVTPTPGLYTGSGGYSWWNDTVFYEIFVRSFYDSNGDGIGDFNGVTAKLDYLKELGISGIWLMPIFPAASYHGYDVTDYYGVNPDFGTMDDFKRLLSEAHKRNIRVIIDMVLNHTSSQHPWFKQAQDPKSPYRNWYIWSDTDPGYVGPMGEKVWYKKDSGYYYAIFWSEMPDLNYRNPDVTKEMDKVTSFWLKDVGVDGFRMDGAKYLVEDGKTQENTPETHAWYKNYRLMYKAINPDAFTIGEVTGDVFNASSYADGDQLDMTFAFELASGLVKSANSGNNNSLNSALKMANSNYKPNQCAPFLTNHDQNRVMSQLNQDPDKANIAASLLLTLPGVPFIYYGEEIGMTGSKPDERIRTPMQWSAEAQAGFTSGTPWESLNDNYKNSNVAAEESDPKSLLNHYKALIALRNQNPALLYGDYVPVDPGNSSVFASLRYLKGEAILVLVNLSDQAVTDYQLAVDSSSLSGTYKTAALMGQDLAKDGFFAPLTVNSSGGFDSYQPLASLPPYSTVIIQLQK